MNMSSNYLSSHTQSSRTTLASSTTMGSQSGRDFSIGDNSTRGPIEGNSTRHDNDEEHPLSALGHTNHAASEGYDGTESISFVDDDEDDDEEDEDGDEEMYDTEEERDEFSVSLAGGGYDDASFISASSVGTDDQTFGTNASSSVQNTETDTDTIRVASKEGKAVWWGRWLTYAILIALSIIVPSCLYYVARKRENEAFEDDAEEFGLQLGDGWIHNLRSAFISLNSVSLQATGPDSTLPWPYVTFPFFHIWATNQQHQTGGIVAATSITPRVELSQRKGYERHVSMNCRWTQSALNWSVDADKFQQNGKRRQTQQLRRVQDGPENPGSSCAPPNPRIYLEEDGSTVNDKNRSVYFPIRTSAPFRSSSINYNVDSNEKYMSTRLEHFSKHSSAGIGPVIEDDTPEGKKILKVFGDLDIKPGELYGTIFFPVFDTMMVDESREVVAVLPSLISWNRLLENMLSFHSVGVICVVESSSCDQKFTFDVTSGNATFVGFGDQYNDASNNQNLAEVTLNELELEKYTISNVGLDSDASCDYTMTIYPSQSTKDQYTTNAPILYASVTFFAFMIVILGVTAYDCIQERRNQSVMKAAMEARAIVSSLFPAVVRDRLFQTNREIQKKKKKLDKKKRLSTGSDEGDNGMMAARKELGMIPGIHSESPNSDDMEKAPKSPLSPSTVQRLMDTMNPPLAGQELPKSSNHASKKGVVSHPKHRLKTFLAHTWGYEEKSDELGAKPIADLFPNTTVLFADIVGFTAWSSEREPEQVFMLLQTVYHAFDKIARRRGVFKVETIGDCYVAVTGLPDQQPDHAVRMTKFARECMTKFADVAKKLEVSLGPDTGDLNMRLGLNSGPVTAGVLQGEKSRFQLFGDTVNTASRMESTGERNRIQISQSTADLLIEAGKSYWVKPREDLVHAKGKGEIQTYWVVSRSNGSAHAQAGVDGHGLIGERRFAPSRTRSAIACAEPTRGLKRTTSDSVAKNTRLSEMMGVPSKPISDQREERLIQWQLELFLRLLKKIVAARGEPKPSSSRYSRQNWRSDSGEEKKDIGEPEPVNSSSDRFDQRTSGGMTTGPMRAPVRSPSFHPPSRHSSAHSLMSSSLGRSLPSLGGYDSTGLTRSGHSTETIDSGMIVFDEVAEVITLPKFDPYAFRALAEAESVELGEAVTTQLQDYITTIAQMYRKNPFHNFEHASHVTMSAIKLLNRIVIPENVDYERESSAIASDLHDYTYGITSDPLTQFAIVFSALVHDVDHTGVPNGQLAKENPDMARVYRNQSIAEQNSVDLAWDLFMDPRYKDLQNCITSSDEERQRFRQLVVNSVMATDIFDKDMKELRNKRWDKAFHRIVDEKYRTINESSMEEDRNMKATIVIEHIIQASDVAHTMQHWHIYQKWNERLFDEMYSAYECGRSGKNPAEFWYKGELWFFDNYVVPLAKKLEECNVFGVASDESLNYAQANRNEWNIKGEEVVRDMIDRYHQRKFFVAGISKQQLKRAVPRKNRGTTNNNGTNNHNNNNNVKEGL